jgi:glycosyltransferase involved in cell wall biosynthesis
MRLTEPILGDYSQLDARIAVWLEQKSLHKIKKVVCPSHHMKEWFEKTYQFSGEVRVIPNLINKEDLNQIDKVDIRPVLSLPGDAILIGIPSAQTQVKGANLIPEILKGLAAKLDQTIGIFLPGEIEPDLRRWMDILPENISIHAPGRLAHHEYLAALKGCSFGIFPSLRDNYSMALLEAVVSGIPMIAFDSGGNADILSDGDTGFLIPNLATQVMIDKAVELVLDPQSLDAITRRTIQYAKIRYDSQKVLDQYQEFLIAGN